MDVLVVLLAATLVFRLLGAAGVGRFGSWAVAAAHGMAVMLVMTASAHFVPANVTAMPNHADMARMVPPIVPFPAAMVYLTGVLELLGAVGLVRAATRRVAAICLALLFVALLPANIHAAVADVPFDGADATPLAIRIPMQLVFIGTVLWVARDAAAASAQRRQPVAEEAPSWTR